MSFVNVNDQPLPLTIQQVVKALWRQLQFTRYGDAAIEFGLSGERSAGLFTRLTQEWYYVYGRAHPDAMEQALGMGMTADAAWWGAYRYVLEELEMAEEKAAQEAAFS